MSEEPTDNLTALPVELTLTKKQAARVLGVPIDTVLNLTRTGQLASIAVGKHKRWTLDDLRAYVEAQRAESVGIRKVG